MRSLGDEVARDEFSDALLRHHARDIVDRAPCGYVATTPDGLISEVNHTFLAWTGFTREELAGRTRFAELLSPGGRIYHDTHYGPLLSMQGSVREMAFEIVRSDRSRIPVLVNAVMERDEAGRPLETRIAIFDATERRAYERELLRAKEAAEAAEHRATALARTLQQTLIPPTPPLIPGLDVGAAYRPSGNGDEVGGDFYDVFQIGDGDWVVLIGDVAGKGVEAAVVTALARYTLRGAAVRSQRPSEALSALNAVLLAEHIDRFCTAAFCRLRLEDGSWSAEIASAGHLPVLLKRADKRPIPVSGPGGLLGVFPEPLLVDTTVPLAGGDCLVLYTDGVTEGRNGVEFYGEGRLERSIEALGLSSAPSLAAGVVDDVVQFQSQQPRDDIAVVAIKVPADTSGVPPT